MIEYDKRSWTSHLFDVEGSMVHEILGRVALCVLWAAIVATVHKMTSLHLGVQPVIHTLVGVALGLLLVFRTNASYDRYWEGRRLWGSIINESRNLARGVNAYLARSAPDLAGPLVAWTAAYSLAVMHNLRGTTLTEEVMAQLEGRIPESDLAKVCQAPHPPLAISLRISQLLAEARDRGAISDIVLGMLDANVQQLIDYLGGCERIKNTPLPYVYVVHLRRALIIYCFTLPFALVEPYGWWEILVVLLTAYTFFGIEEIGVEIENPFGHDANDLPLERFCSIIHRDVMGALPETETAGVPA